MKEFGFTGCIEIKELLGKKAYDEQKLMELIEQVPIDSIYYHTHSYFLRHAYVSGPYPNDFANWAVIQVRDRVLGEQLAVINPVEVKDMEEIRQEILTIIDRHLSRIKIIPYVVYGQPFYFMKSRIIEVPTGLWAKDLSEFIECLKKVDSSAIYNHIFEGRLRDRQGRSDFSMWLGEVLGYEKIAVQIEKIDSYMYTLEDLRQKILQICLKEQS